MKHFFNDFMTIQIFIQIFIYLFIYLFIISKMSFVSIIINTTFSNIKFGIFLLNKSNSQSFYRTIEFNPFFLLFFFEEYMKIISHLFLITYIL
jgi:hypothetical protein